MSRNRTHRILRVAAAIAVLGASVAGAACGSSEPTAEDRFREALSADALGELRSGRLDGEIALTGIPQADVRAGITGTFDGDSADLNGTASGSTSQTGRFDVGGRLRTTGGDVFIAGSGGPFYEVTAELLERLAPEGAEPADVGSFEESCREGIEQGGGDPDICDDLRPAEWVGEVTDEGEVTIGGETATRYVAQLDVERIAGDVYDLVSGVAPLGAAGLGDRDAFLQQAREVITTATVEVARGDDDGIPRLFAFDLGISFLGQEIGLALDLELTDVNEPHPVEAPDGALPLERLRPELPAELRPLFDCVLDAKDSEALNACVGALPGLGAGGDPAQSV